jgi:DNA-binding FadR family transcriptional regulator
VLLPPLHDLVAPAAVEEVIAEQHRDLLRAIRRGDPAAAERAMREHLTYLRDLVDLVREAGA